MGRSSPPDDHSPDRKKPGLLFVVWKDEYSVKVKRLDAQHKRILEAINELYASLQQGGDPAALNRILADLVDYTHTHLAYEEQLLELCGYAEFDRHKALHDAMAKRTLAIQKQHHDWPGDLSREVLGFLKDWWVNHIQAVDRNYVSCLEALKDKLRKRKQASEDDADPSPASGS